MNVDALGDGMLMFDWDGMKERQMKMKEEWIKKHGTGDSD